jgi:AcrR family transcriptional regulator
MNSKERTGPRRRLTRAEAKARTRQLLLDSAARTFAANGYAGASVEQIAEDAGFSIGALYSNFSGKQELFLALMKERARDRLTDTEHVLEQNYPGAADAWTAFGQQMVDVADKDFDLAPLQAEFWLYAVRHPEAMETFAAQVRERRMPLEDLIAAGLAADGADYPPGLPGRVAIVISALFQGMVRQRRIDPANVPAELYADALRWLFTGIRECEPALSSHHSGRQDAKTDGEPQ